MTLNPIIKQLYYSDQLWFSETIALLRNTYDKKLSRFFMYADENYPDYLKTVSLDERNFWIFYCINEEDNNFLGFAIFKKAHNNLFLNQIIIKPEFRNQGLGSFLMMGVINVLYERYGKGYFKYFELETFYSNTGARLLYNKHGMKISGINNWYKIALPKPAQSIAEVVPEARTGIYNLIPDQSGFVQIYRNHTHIGVMISKRFVRLKAEALADMDGILQFVYNRLKAEAVCLTSRSELNFPLLDQCISYRIPFSKILKLNPTN